MTPTSTLPAERTAFRIAYDGAAYRGFQRQPNVHTVEDALLAGLVDLDILRDTGSIPPAYTAAGRTDAGVSAIGQTVAFQAPPWLSPSVFSRALPADIVVWASASVSDDFHARFDAVERTYEYHLHVGSTPFELDDARVALDRLSGEHDFHNLTPDHEGTTRKLSATVRMEPPFAVLTLRSGGFPRQLVRRVATVVTEVATGSRDLTTIDRILGDDPIDGPEGIEPAPAHSLVFSSVRYPGVEFDPDPVAVTEGRSAFTTRRNRLETRARVVDHVVGGLSRAVGSGSDEETD